ncbi:hypothetical protein WOLCODRAFT_22950 [Wolfiporia cocos MD-104 SS10]|uniref:Uncharacterized protein n=1 Tax=Wolfiporia cocos (strain MD-104) TaxID=742152 RepID=A0A2H3J6T5_WOLCO|nr:hypothetical protein WOLCODRAFT_22950 [Wolfiporia cocos MD-104 SS10]
MTSPVPPPSRFAALLRQSKFASFDPNIAQTYVSYGGHAHRGNWGLKRPLPLHRRNAVVTVKAIDSRQQQTEWGGAERQHNWIRMWEEVGVAPDVPEVGPWGEKLGPLASIQWDIDSEFGAATQDSQRDDLGAKDELERRSMAVPNVHAMSDKQFARYLEEVRALRPAFRAWLQQEGKAGSSTSMWERSQSASEEFREFLESKAYEKYNAPGSRVIEQQPQRFGGLTYTRTGTLQAALTNKGRPGHILHQHDRRGGFSVEDSVASFAGMTSSLTKRRRASRYPVDWNGLAQDGERKEDGKGIANLRLAKAEILSAPVTVGHKPGGLGQGMIKTEVYVDAATEQLADNTYKPGSPEYISNIREPVSKNNAFTTVAKTARPTARYKGEVNRNLLMDTLQSVMQRSQKPDQN